MFDREDKHKTRLMAQLAGKAIPQPSGWNVLIAIFVRPDKTEGGIFLADKTRDEDEYQGRVGLVLSVGEDAYQGDRMRNFTGPWVKSGDWVIFPAFENSATKFKYNGIAMAVVPDDRIIAKVVNPMDVF